MLVESNFTIGSAFSAMTVRMSIRFGCVMDTSGAAGGLYPPPFLLFDNLHHPHDHAPVFRGLLMNHVVLDVSARKILEAVFESGDVAFDFIREKLRRKLFAREQRKNLRSSSKFIAEANHGEYG